MVKLIVTKDLNKEVKLTWLFSCRYLMGNINRFYHFELSELPYKMYTIIFPLLEPSTFRNSK